DTLAAATPRLAGPGRDRCRLDRACGLRHRGDAPFRPYHGVGRTATVRRGPDGATASVGRRSVLATRPRGGARAIAGVARVRRVVSGAGLRPLCDGACPG